MWIVALGGSGVIGFIYFMLNIWWPGWYLDWVYRRQAIQFTNKLTATLASGKLLVDIFEDHAKVTPKKNFILYKDEVYTYGDMDKLANKAGRAAIEMGVKPGSTIAVMIGNDPSFVWCYLGFMKVGYEIAFININLRAGSLSHSIKSSGSNVLIVGRGEALTDAVLEIRSDIPDITIYGIGMSAHTSFLSFDLVFDRMSDGAIDRKVRSHVNPLSTCILIYTSGTTGYPKPAIVTHARTVGVALRYHPYMSSGDDVFYCTLPLYHSAALLIGFGNVVSTGSSMVLNEKFSARHFWEDCRKYNITVIQYIGEICRYLVAQPKTKDDRNHTVRVAIGNGLRQDIWGEFQQRFNIANIVEFYGATEGPVGLTNFTNKIGSCGRSSPYLRKFSPVAFLKFDLEAQAPERNKAGYCIPIGTDEVGLMAVQLIKGKTSFHGYRGKKSDTEKKLLHNVLQEGDTYYNTGDLFRVDDQYYVYFNDRIGDTFRWKGENVSTTEVSNILTDLEFVHDANVYGVTVPGADGRAGMAALHLNDPTLTMLTTEMVNSLSNHVRHVLPSYARPRFIRIQKEFDMTSTFKQQKTALVREGFDVTLVKDPIFYLNVETMMYQPLNIDVYRQIVARKTTL